MKVDFRQGFGFSRSASPSRPGPTGVESVYEVASASKSDEGAYICKAANEAGEREEMVQVIITEYGAGGSGGGGAGGGIGGGGWNPNWRPGGGETGGGRPGGGTGGGGAGAPVDGVEVASGEVNGPLGGNAELRCFVIGRCSFPIFIMVG